MKSIKCVVCGDGEVGKTGMLITFTTGTFPTNYIPTVFDNYSHNMTVEGVEVCLQLWDTAGQEDYKSLRTLSYPNTDIFIICFSAVSPDSFDNVKDEWLPEIDHYAPGVPKVLVATKIDLREDETIKKNLSEMQKKPLTKKEGERMAKAIRAEAYHECSSALPGSNQVLEKIFQNVVQIASRPERSKAQRPCSLL